MIFYFSGTGNSYNVAKKIGQFQKERIYDIAQELYQKENLFQYRLETNEKLGFVFPVYAWQPPGAVMDFIRKSQFHIKDNNYIFAVATCGGEAGKALSILDKVLQNKKMKLDSAFTVAMPDNFVIGMEVETEQEIKDKLEKADLLIHKINRVIKHERKKFFKVKRGNFSTIKSSIFVQKLFNTCFVKTDKFYVTKDCIGCGLCEEICTSRCIKLDEEQKPVWTKKNCNICLACINRCPKKAIQYGKRTISRGRYVHPML